MWMLELTSNHISVVICCQGQINLKKNVKVKTFFLSFFFSFSTWLFLIGRSSWPSVPSGPVLVSEVASSELLLTSPTPAAAAAAVQIWTWVFPSPRVKGRSSPVSYRKHGGLWSPFFTAAAIPQWQSRESKVQGPEDGDCRVLKQRPANICRWWVSNVEAVEGEVLPIFLPFCEQSLWCLGGNPLFLQ